MLSVSPDILTELPWAQLLVNGLALGSLYALTAFGIVLIYKTTQVITFAQGETAMFSTFVAFTLLTVLQLPFAVVFVLTLVFAGLFGALIERAVLRRISSTSVLNPVIVTVGLSLILLGAAVAVIAAMRKLLVAVWSVATHRRPFVPIMPQLPAPKNA